MILGVKVHISMMAEQIQLKFKMIFVLLQGILKWWSSVIKLQMHEKHFLVPVMYLAVWHTIVCLDYHDKWNIYYASLLTAFNLLHSSMLFKKYLCVIKVARNTKEDTRIFYWLSNYVVPSD